MIPRAALPVLLIKLRTQYGLRRFAKIGIILYTLVPLVGLVALAAAAPLSTLAFLYMLEPLLPQAKMILGLPLAMVLLMTGPTLARVVGPALIADGGMGAVHMTGLSLALMSLTLVFRLPLRPVPRAAPGHPLASAAGAGPARRPDRGGPHCHRRAGCAPRRYRGRPCRGVAGRDRVGEQRDPRARRWRQGAVHAGQYVTPGTALVPHVGTDLCVIANFRETAMAGLQVGSGVSLTVDALQDRRLNGQADGLSPATASEFSLLPPAQRLPGRIRIDSGQDRAGLRYGMSVVVRADG